MPSNSPSFTIFASPQHKSGPSSHSFGNVPSTCLDETRVGKNYPPPPPPLPFHETERDKMENGDRWVSAVLSKLNHTMECIHESDPGSPSTGKRISCGCASCCHSSHPSSNFSHHKNHHHNNNNISRKNSGDPPFSFPYLAAGLESVNENERKGPHTPPPSLFSSSIIPSAPPSQRSVGDLADGKKGGVSPQVRRGGGGGKGEHGNAVMEESVGSRITSTTTTTDEMHGEQQDTVVSHSSSHVLHLPTRQRATPHNMKERRNGRGHKELGMDEKKEEGEGEHHDDDVVQKKQDGEETEDEILLFHGGDRDESLLPPPLPPLRLSSALPTVGVDQISSSSSSSSTTTTTATLHVPKSWTRVKKSPSQAILTARKSVGNRRDRKEGKNHPRDLFSHIDKEEGGLFAVGIEAIRNVSFPSLGKEEEHAMPHSEAGREKISVTTTAHTKRLGKLTKSPGTPMFTDAHSPGVKGGESERSPPPFISTSGHVSRQISSSLSSSSFCSPSSCIGVTSSACPSREEGGLPTWKKHHHSKGETAFFSLSSKSRDPSGVPSSGEEGDNEAPRKRGSKKRQGGGAGGGGKKKKKETEPSGDGGEGVLQRRRTWCIQHVPFAVRFLLALLVIGLANFCFTAIAFVLYIKVGKAAGL